MSSPFRQVRRLLGHADHAGLSPSLAEKLQTAVADAAGGPKLLTEPAKPGVGRGVGRGGVGWGPRT